MKEKNMQYDRRRDPVEKRQYDRSVLIKIVKDEINGVSDGDLMDILDVLGFEFTCIRHNVYEYKGWVEEQE